MDQSAYFESWNRALAQELQACCKQTMRLKLKRQHTLEIVAACHGMDSHTLLHSGLTEQVNPVIPDEIPWDYVTQRILKTAPGLSESQVVGIRAVIEQLWSEQVDPQTAFAKRLVRNIASNCTFHGDCLYSGSVLLPEKDWLACGEIVCRDDFEDGLAVQSPWPSILTISRASPEPCYDNHYQMEPDCILNVLAFLRPNDWDDLLARYRD